MENIEIRKVTVNDIETLQQIGRQTFAETFSDSNSEENIAKYLEEGFCEQKLRKEVRNLASQFYFAELNCQVIGYLKLNTGTSQTESQNVKALEIERIYVLGAYHGKKVGQLLYNKAMEVADELNSAYVWLGVWEENPRAIRFYQKNGFIEFNRHIFQLGEEEQIDIMMKKNLNTSVNLQPTLENESIILYPLKQDDFNTLYAVAADPDIWAQHPNKDRWKKEVFQTFFEGALQSEGAFRIASKETGMTIGSTRFYDYNREDSGISIGYTFYATAYWGKGVNPMVKALMLDYIFRFVDRVNFHIGAENIRSQKAISRLGAVKVAEKDVTYFGEESKLNFVYQITKTGWKQL